MSGTPKILLVDDNAAMTAVCSRALKLAGDYEIREVNDASQAVQVALEFHPDLIVLDLVMPEMTGEAVLAGVRTLPELDATHVLILTGKKPSYLGMNANTSIVFKPIQISELLGVVESILAKAPKERCGEFLY